MEIKKYFFLPGNEPNDPRGSNSSNPLVSSFGAETGTVGAAATGGGATAGAAGGPLGTVVS